MPLSAAAAPGLGPAALSLDPQTSNGLQGMPAALHSQHQQQQFIAPMLQLGCMPGAAAAAALPPHLQGMAGAAPLLQLAAAAQQVAQMQQFAQVQQQLNAVSLNPACRNMQHGVGAGGMPGYLGGHAGAPAFLGMASQPLPGHSYQDMQQLSSMMGSMCQV
jgi:hypothetical protein